MEKVQIMFGVTNDVIKYKRTKFIKKTISPTKAQFD